jgi:transcriptional regulator with GAF, ATPase, and Fis domain
VDLSCVALLEHLIESELFGYEKGAFSGGDASKPGLFEMANGSTIFLDEIGEL